MQQGKNEQVEALCLRALQIGEQILGREHPQLIDPLNNLGILYRNKHKYEQSEAMYQRAVQIGEQMLGSTHPWVIYPLNGLANVYNEQGKYGQATSTTSIPPESTQ